MWLDITIAVTCGMSGLVCGWIMNALHRSAVADCVLPTPAMLTTTASDDPTLTNHGGRDVASKLMQFAAGIAADVDLHQSRVQRVSNDIHTDNDQPSATQMEAWKQELIAANEELQAQLRSTQEQLQLQTIELETAERRAQTDALTRVSNRHAFDETLVRQHALGHADAGVLALFDVDHFKQFNDNYGHCAGDDVLRVVAGIINARLQPYGVVARFGGEEFAAILRVNDLRTALPMIEQTRMAIGQRDIRYGEQSLRVTACVGVSRLQPGQTVQQWVQSADAALYRSKDQGRNCGHWIDGDVPRLIDLDRLPEQSSHAVPIPSDPARPDHAEPEATPAETTPAETPPAETTSNSPADERPHAASPMRSPLPAADLPTMDQFALVFDDMHRRTVAMMSTLHLMAVHLSADANGSGMRSLLQLIRGGARNVDRIGCHDAQTLLLLIAGQDEATVVNRASQIQSAAIAMKLGDTRQGAVVGIGIVASATHGKFTELIDQSVTAARDACQPGHAPIAFLQEAD